MVERIALLIAAVALSGCASTGACGCPALLDGPFLNVSPASLALGVPGMPMPLSIIFGGLPGTKLAETDACGKPSARFVTVSVTLSKTAGEATAVVTPMSAGSCMLTFALGRATRNVAVTVTGYATPSK